MSYGGSSLGGGQTRADGCTRSVDLDVGETECSSERGTGDLGGTNSSDASSCDPFGRQGGVGLRDPVDMIRSLLACGLSPDLASTVVISYYNAARVGSEVAGGQGVSVGSGSRKSQYQAERTRKWVERMQAMPYTSGQCYLHVIRFGRRNKYLAALKSTPSMRAFVQMLEPGDLKMDVAKEIGLWRLDTDGYSTDIQYHVAYECDNGTRVGSVYECIACMLRMFPRLNSQFKCDIDGVPAMPLVGTIGAATRVSSPVAAASAERVRDAHRVGVGLGVVQVAESRLEVDGVLYRPGCGSDDHVLVPVRGSHFGRERQALSAVSTLSAGKLPPRASVYYFPPQSGTMSVGLTDVVNVELERYRIVSHGYSMLCFEAGGFLEVGGCRVYLGDAVTVLLLQPGAVLTGCVSTWYGDKPSVYWADLTWFSFCEVRNLVLDGLAPTQAAVSLPVRLSPMVVLDNAYYKYGRVKFEDQARFALRSPVGRNRLAVVVHAGRGRFAARIELAVGSSMTFLRLVSGRGIILESETQLECELLPAN